jgi:hypothetical protein
MFVHKHRNICINIYITDVVFSVGINNVPSVVSKFNYALESSPVRNSDLEVRSYRNASVIFGSVT